MSRWRIDKTQVGYRLDGCARDLVANQMVERSGGTMTVTLENPKVRRILEVSGLMGTGPFVLASEQDPAAGR